MAHEHSDDAVDFLGVCALERLAVFELVVVEDGIAEAVVVDGVVVDEYSSGLDAVLEYLHGGGEVAVGLLDRTLSAPAAASMLITSRLFHGS